MSVLSVALLVQFKKKDLSISFLLHQLEMRLSSLLKYNCYFTKKSIKKSAGVTSLSVSPLTKCFLKKLSLIICGSPVTIWLQFVSKTETYLIYMVNFPGLLKYI